MEYCWCRLGFCGHIANPQQSSSALPFLNFTLSTFKDVYGVPVSACSFSLGSAAITCDETSSGKDSRIFTGAGLARRQAVSDHSGADHANGDACADADAGPGIGLTLNFYYRIRRQRNHITMSHLIQPFLLANGSGDLHQVWYEGLIR